MLGTQLSKSNGRLSNLFNGEWPFDLSFRDCPTFRHFDCDVVDQANQYLVQVDLPGVSKEDVNIQLDKGILTISGIRKSDETQENENYCLSERKVGKFSRSLRLPEEIDATKVSASLDNGVLSISVPKSEKALPQKIAIK